MNRVEKFIVHSSPGQRVIDLSKRLLLPGFHGLPLYDVVKFLIKQVRKVGLNERASAIAFNFLMAIPAGTIFLCTLIPYLPVSKEVTNELLGLVRDYTINENTYHLIKNFLDDFLNTERTGLLSLGFLLVIYYASNAMMCIMRSFDRSLIYSSRRNFLEKRWMAIRLTLFELFLFLFTIVILAFQGPVLNWILDLLNIENPVVRAMVVLVRWLIMLGLIYYSIAFIYKYAPAVHKRWRLGSPGTTFATVVIILTTFIFSFWVNHFGNFNKVYGSIGTILIIMILVYINSLILLVGYELNVSIHSLKHQADEREKRETDGTHPK